MKHLFFLLVVCLLFTSCSHKITRVGYQTKSTNNSVCDIVINKNTVLSDSLAVKLGDIKLGDTGFSMECTEADAITILKEEGCAIGANYILITAESRPDIVSSCYRCRASFYVLSSSTLEAIQQNSEPYKPENVALRVAKDKKRNARILVGCTIGGIVAGIVLAGAIIGF